MAIKNYLINDKWLDIDKQNIVEVKSTDGVIGSVKLNGEEYGGSGGGGSSDFSTATVEFISSSGTYDVMCCNIVDNALMLGDYKTVTAKMSWTYTIPLLNGVAYLNQRSFIGIDTSVMPTMEGSIELGQDVFIITGDGTITAKGQ